MIKTTSNVPIHVLTHPQMEVDDEQGYPYFRKPPNQKRKPVHPPRFTPQGSPPKPARYGTTALSSAMGVHLVGSVGGGDMPCCITVLKLGRTFPAFG